MAGRLPISDNFMFGRVLCNEEVCRGFLERVLGIDVGGIAYLNREQVFQPAVDARGVRLDVYAETGAGVVDVEMQANPHTAPGRRLRYYQAGIDSGLMDRGAAWRDLHDSYIIFACDFDWFGAGLPVYTFENLCREDPSVSAATGAVWKILNARAAGCAPTEGMRNLLEYLRKGAVAPGDRLVTAMDAEVSTANEDREWVGSVMTVRDLMEDVRLDAQEQGLAEGRAQGMAEGMAQGMAQGREEGRAELAARMAALAARLAEEDRAEDAFAAMADPSAAERLFRAYGI